MNAPNLDPILLLIFFTYGLAFFGMGLALALEIGRSPALAEARLLRPLAIFGILHGIHEWLEFFVLQSALLGIGLPMSTSWLRLALLTASFAALLIYGGMAGGASSGGRRWTSPIVLALAVYASGIVLAAARAGPPQGAADGVRMTDALVRYLLAVPGALLAARALQAESRRLRREGGNVLAVRMTWAAGAFAVYGASQVFVPKLTMFPANIINADLFLQLTGAPHQVLRTALAAIIALSLLQAVQLVEKRRHEAVLAAQQGRLEALQQQETLRRQLLRHTVRAQEDERARIARELHDETAQSLSAFSLELAALRSVAQLPADDLARIERLQELSRSVSQGLYRLVHDLRPAQLDDLGLVPALKHLLEKELCPKGMEVEIVVDGATRRLDALVETVLYRVAQEALNNTARHSGTKRARILLTFRFGEIEMLVQDSGCGFDASESFRAPRGWGLAGMRERVESVGGKLDIRSSARAGTAVEIRIPLQAQEEVAWNQSG